MERRAGVGPAGHGRPLASRWVLSMLAPSLPTSWKTTHRFTMSKPDTADGRREPSLGRSAGPRRIVKVGITVSERTVSRYLRDRPRAPSQTWRTFFANHLGQLALISPAPYATCADDVIDISGLTFRQRPLSGDELYASYQCAVIDWPASLQRRSLGTHIVQDHVCDCAAIHNSGGRDPPTHLRLRPTHDGCVDNRLLLLYRTSATNDSVRP